MTKKHTFSLLFNACWLLIRSGTHSHSSFARFLGNSNQFTQTKNLRKIPHSQSPQFHLALSEPNQRFCTLSPDFDSFPLHHSSIIDTITFSVDKQPVPFFPRLYLNIRHANLHLTKTPNHPYILVHYNAFISAFGRPRRARSRPFTNP